MFTKTALKVLSPITPIRRVSSLPDNIDDQNYIRAVGLTALALNFLPEDCRDLKASATQIASKFSKKVKYVPSYNYVEYQHTFYFFKGALLEFLLKLPGEWGEKLADRLHENWDKPIGQTKIW